MTRARQERTRLISEELRHKHLEQANDKDTDKETLERLSQSNDEIIRGAVALNPNTLTDVLEVLLDDTSEHVRSCLRKRGLKTKPLFIKPQKIIGNKLIFRNVTTADAEIIVELRTDPRNSKFLSSTSPNVEKQVSWLKSYSLDNSQVYFLIEDKEGNNIGTGRLYDKQDDSFSCGSWIIRDGSPITYSIESLLILYHFALSLCFTKAHFFVRKGNDSVCKFHESFGAIKCGETKEDFFFKISPEAIDKSLAKYSRYLPNGIEIFY